MIIKTITLHQLKKNTSADYDLVKRASPIHCDDKTTALLSSLISEYNHKQSKLFGGFDQDNKPTLFQNELNSYLQKTIDFTHFSIDTATEFKNQLKDAGLTLEGYLVFIHYSLDNLDYLLISLLKPVRSIGVTQSLDLADYEYLDVNRLHLACRINLYEYGQNKLGSYISWLQPTTGRKLTACFCQWIGTASINNPRHDTKLLVQAFNEYCDTQLDNTERVPTKQKAYDYCQSIDEEGVSIKDLSAQISKHNPDDFARFINTRDYDIAPQIIPSKSQLRPLIKYSAKGQGFNISFDANLLHSTVVYDKENNQLIIKDIPDTLKKQLDTQY